MYGKYIGRNAPGMMQGQHPGMGPQQGDARDMLVQQLMNPREVDNSKLDVEALAPLGMAMAEKYRQQPMGGQVNAASKAPEGMMGMGGPSAGGLTGGTVNPANKAIPVTDTPQAQGGLQRLLQMFGG